MQTFLASLTYPVNLSLCVFACGALALLLRRWRMGGALVVFALAWSLMWSVPWCSDRLRASLERRHAIVMVEDLPEADAIVVLGGGSYRAWKNRSELRPERLKSSRLAAGARAWLAGRAPVIVLSGGGDEGRSEAGTMATAIAMLGVPPSALILEKRSIDTRGNARETAAVMQQRGMRSALLVTSSLHMPRALLLFRQTGLEVIAVPVPEPATGGDGIRRWLPARSALWRSGRALKEYAGLAAAQAEAAMNGNLNQDDRRAETR